MSNKIINDYSGLTMVLKGNTFKEESVFPVFFKFNDFIKSAEFIAFMKKAKGAGVDVEPSICVFKKSSFLPFIKLRSIHGNKEYDVNSITHNLRNLTDDLIKITNHLFCGDHVMDHVSCLNNLFCSVVLNDGYLAEVKEAVIHKPSLPEKMNRSNSKTDVQYFQFFYVEIMSFRKPPSDGLLALQYAMSSIDSLVDNTTIQAEFFMRFNLDDELWNFGFSLYTPADSAFITSIDASTEQFIRPIEKIKHYFKVVQLENEVKYLYQTGFEQPQHFDSLIPKGPAFMPDDSITEELIQIPNEQPTTN